MEMQIKTIMRFHYIPVEWPKKTDKVQVYVKDRATGALTHAGGDVKWYNQFGSFLKS